MNRYWSQSPSEEDSGVPSSSPVLVDLEELSVYFQGSSLFVDALFLEVHYFEPKA